jgi:hypothetical protein
MQTPENEKIIEQVLEIGREVESLGSRSNIAANVQKTIHQDAEELVRKCDEILNPKK